jgi:hypothetical protein
VLFRIIAAFHEDGLFVNNFMRPNQNKNNNNRNRNRNNNRRNTGGNLGGGSGNNKVYDSNGPDIKLRGTTQTIAEKYMQLGRDAQSAGDIVAAENYYQHAEHYYRLWAANQPAGHSLQMSRKLGEDEIDEEGDEVEGGEDEAVDGATPDAATLESAAPVDGEVPVDGQPPRQNRNNNYRDNNNRNGNDRSFRPRWQNNRNNRNYENRDPAAAPEQVSSDAAVEFVAPAPAPVEAVQEGQWEAPSFLQRPTPVAVEAAPEVAEAAPAPRKYRPRKPRVEEAAAPDEGSAPAE